LWKIIHELLPKDNSHFLDYSSIGYLVGSVGILAILLVYLGERLRLVTSHVLLHVIVILVLSMLESILGIITVDGYIGVFFQIIFIGIYIPYTFGYSATFLIENGFLDFGIYFSVIGIISTGLNFVVFALLNQNLSDELKLVKEIVLFVLTVLMLIYPLLYFIVRKYRERNLKNTLPRS